MYSNKVKFLGVVKGSLRTNLYNVNPYREIGLVDVYVSVEGTKQRFVMPMYRSSGTNSGKCKGDWYPILGIKECAGEFKEFNPIFNDFLNKSVEGHVDEGWIIKNLFFRTPLRYKSEDNIPVELKSLRGYGYTSHGYFLKELAIYVKNEFNLFNNLKCPKMDMYTYNDIIHDDKIYYAKNTMSQAEIMSSMLMDIVNELCS